ncbi:MAG: hypothetical protein A4E27_01384 [Methanobacterium sp. PtaU1.Bin242]|nr:MAG: hypothetical protein A4E27_01384 [Methanobacterium sp. PtaU1.Bin242]
MKPSEIALMRLQNQQLTHPRFKNPEEVISWLGAVQGQDYPGAKWAVGLRLPGSTDADLEQAITQKKILRTWLMRGTLQLVTAEDIHWMLELLSPRIIKSNKRRYQELELDEETLNQSNQILKDALNYDGELNRKELLNILQKEGISTEGQRAAYMLQRASLEGLICQCGVQRNIPIYMSMDSVPQTKTLKHDDALAELARRYFTSRGPATLGDFIWWSGLLAADARTGLEAIQSDLTEETIHGQIHWYSDTKPLVEDDDPTAHLLPTFDEYLFGYQDRSAVIDSLAKIKLSNRYRSTIAINGQIVGTWRRTFKKDKVIIEQELFKTPHGKEMDILNQAKLSYGEFLNLEVQ